MTARVWKQGLPQAVRTLLEMRPVSEETADVWRRSPGFWGRTSSLSRPRGCAWGPGIYHTPQVDPETRASGAAGSESLPFPLKLRWALWGLEPGGAWDKPTPWRVPAGLRFASAAGPTEKTGITWAALQAA